MKRVLLTVLALGIVFASCNHVSVKKKTTGRKAGVSQQMDPEKDIEEIRNLIRKAEKWAESRSSIDLLPATKDSLGEVYTGFDMDKLGTNLDKLRTTGFFADEFIDNYKQIILTLDSKLKNGDLGEWMVGDFPPFRFASVSSPWCACQDIPYSKPEPWRFLDVEVQGFGIDSAQATWGWGDPKTLARIGDFSYKFRTVKENGVWKIAWMQEFDFDKSTNNSI